MAGIKATAQVDGVATGTAKKTIIQLLAPTNQKLIIKEWSISFNGTSNTAEPIKVQLHRQTDAGTMSALTLAKINTDDAETLQATGTYNATVEPTTTTEVFGEYVHPQGGYTWQAPFGGEINVAGGGRIGLTVTAAASVSCKARLVYEE